jgi:5-methylcytosine-specific restriction endonuclease McrA
MLKTREEIKKYISNNGGYTKANLAKLGVDWPPRKGWKKKLLGKNPNKRKENYKKRRQQVLKHLGLNEYSTNAGVCLAIHNETGWPIPDKACRYRAYITRFSRQLNRTKKLPNSKQRSKIKDFYNSKQWKELRYTALRMSEGRCQICGATAQDGVRIHVDHIKPRSKYPELELDLDNLQVACEDCNYGKMNYDEFNFKDRI